MNFKTTVPLEGVASAQLIRPDVAQAQWLAFPLAALAWHMCQPLVVHWDATTGQALEVMELDAHVFVEQTTEFDIWRVGGGVAFRW